MRRVAMISVHGCPLAPLGGQETGGMNVYIRELSRELGGRGVEVDVFTRWHDLAVPQIEPLGPNARVIHIPAGPVGMLAKDQVYDRLPEFAGNMCQFVSTQGLSYDLIHSHYWLSGLVASFLAPRWDVPFVAMFHTLGEAKNHAWHAEAEPPRRLRMERRVVAEADALVAASHDERQVLIETLGADPASVDVIPCGVDLERFRPLDKGEARRALGLGPQKIVLFVGRLDPLKGLDRLLRSVPLLQYSGAVKVLVVGGGDDSSGELTRMQRLAADLGIADRVEFVGAIGHDRLPLFYSAADLCVVPSHYESFGMVALEALACGLPIVASDVGGLQITVQDGETGYLVPWPTPEGFAAHVDMLLSDAARLRRFAAAARPSVLPYGWPGIADRVQALYRRLLAAFVQDRTGQRATDWPVLCASARHVR